MVKRRRPPSFSFFSRAKEFTSLYMVKPRQSGHNENEQNLVTYAKNGKSSQILVWSEVKSFSRVQLFATPWTVAHQAPPSMEFSRQEYWSGLPFPSPGDLPNPGIEARSTALQEDSLPTEPPGSPRILEWVAYPFSSGSLQPRNGAGVSCIAGEFFFPGELPGKPQTNQTTNQMWTQNKNSSDKQV